MEYIAAAIAFVALLAWDGWRRFIDTRNQRLADEVADRLRSDLDSVQNSNERAHAKLLEHGHRIVSLSDSLSEVTEHSASLEALKSLTKQHSTAISAFEEHDRRLKALEDEAERMKSIVSRTASGIDHITGARRRKAV